eukprot:6309069-Amphidinium_carterae.1
METTARARAPSTPRKPLTTCNSHAIMDVNSQCPCSLQSPLCGWAVRVCGPAPSRCMGVHVRVVIGSMNLMFGGPFRRRFELTGHYNTMDKWMLLWH